jgi:hypothetical protein
MSQIKNYPYKEVPATTDKLLLQDGSDNAYKHTLISAIISSNSGLSPWITKNANSTAKPGDRIIADMSSNWSLIFPSNPQPGNEISILPVNIGVNLLNVTGVNKFESVNVAGFGLNKNLTAVSFIYINNTIGWVQDPRDIAYALFPGVPLLFASNGDANGVFYYLGRNKNTQTWTNPKTENRLGVTASSVLGGQSPIESLVDRSESHFHTNSQSNPWIEFDILNPNSLLLTHWSYRARDNDPSYIPSQLSLSASIDGTSYVEIDRRSFAVTQNNWVTFPVSVPNQVYYRKFKFTLPAATYFTAGEFELYGFLKTS